MQGWLDGCEMLGQTIGLNKWTDMNKPIKLSGSFRT